MPTITVEDISPDLYEQLEQTAAAHHRSVASEIIFCLEHTLSKRSFDTEEILSRARTLRQKTAQVILSEEEITQAKIERYN